MKEFDSFLSVMNSLLYKLIKKRKEKKVIEKMDIDLKTSCICLSIP